MRIRKTLWNNDAEPIVVIMIILLVLGSLNVFSSSFVLATTDYDNPYYFLQRHCIMLFVGLLGFIVCRKLDYHNWRPFMPGIIVLMFIALVAVLVIGVEINGAKRWLPLGPASFQPAEFAKLVSIMLISAYLAACVKRGRKPSLFNKQLGIIFMMAVVTELEPDMGTACIIFGVPVLMLITVGLPRWELAAGAAVGVGGVIGLVALQPYRLERIKVMFDPWADAQGVGYQTVQSLSTIGSGGLLGMGLGGGVSKYEYLPEAHTDFAFAIFCQEHGYIGAFFVFLMFALLLLYCARVANRATDEFGQMLAMGVMLLIMGQAIANIAMVGGMFAVVGVPLPFISYGGSSLIVTMSAMGILLNICDHSLKSGQEQPPPRPAALQPGREAASQGSHLHLVK